jgi:hypothetical protein
MRVIRTPIVNFLPQLKLHHLIVLSNNDENVYTIDFTPICNRENLISIFNLIAGKNTKGQVRLMVIKNTGFYDTDKIIPIWENICITHSEEVSYQIHESIQNNDMKIITRILLNWKRDKNQELNLYFRNCIHFSNYVKRIVKNYNEIFFDGLFTPFAHVSKRV